MIRSLGDKVPKIHPTAYISEAAYVAGDVEIGENSSVWPGAVIRGDFGKIVIGKNSHIEDNCVVHTGESVTIGDNVIVGHAVTVHCRKIGNNCMIGIGAILLQGAEIEDGCFIAAGSLVAPNEKTQPRSLYMGSPARRKEQLSDDKIAMVRAGTDFYNAMARKYQELGY
jgi:carbonic anhydrase/acetyltransferase-like protein (isoleucine patch superfamily)